MTPYLLLVEYQLWSKLPFDMKILEFSDLPTFKVCKRLFYQLCMRIGVKSKHKPAIPNQHKSVV